MAAGTGKYKRILELVERWPLDKNKTGRDFGEYLRKDINKAYKENKFEENHQFWDRQYLALSRLLNNEHYNRYPRLLSSSATGLTAEQCNIALSTEVLENLEREERTVLQKLFSIKLFKTK